MSEEIKITLNSAEAQADMENLGDKADAVSEEVDQLMTEAEVKTDLTWLKAAHTVQQITTILRQALQIAGVSLGRVGSATLQVVTQAAAVLTPLFAAQTLSGWQTASAVLGLIELGISVYELPGLIREAKMAGELETAFISNMNINIGNIGFNIG